MESCLFSLKNPFESAPVLFKNTQNGVCLYWNEEWGPSFFDTLWISNNCNTNHVSFIDVFKSDQINNFEYDPTHKSSLFVNTDEKDKQNHFVVSDYEVYSIWLCSLGEWYSFFDLWQSLLFNEKDSLFCWRNQFIQNLKIFPTKMLKVRESWFFREKLIFSKKNRDFTTNLGILFLSVILILSFNLLDVVIMSVPDEFEWERSKENVIPLKGGRDVRILNQMLNPDHKNEQRNEVELKNQYAWFEFDWWYALHRSYLKNIQNYTGNDPLSVWVEYSLF